MKLFLVVWNFILTIMLLAVIIIGGGWNAILTEITGQQIVALNNLERWFEDSYQDSVKAIVDIRMQEYVEELIKAWLP